MNHLLPSHSIAGIIGFGNHDNTLLVIFGFVICIVVIKQISRFQRARLWHDTARIALEKGQPVPTDGPDKFAKDEFRRCRSDRFGRRDHWSFLHRALVMLAVGVALYVALPEDGKVWALIPGLIGVANLISWLIFSLRPNKPDDRQDPSNQA